MTFVDFGSGSCKKLLVVMIAVQFLLTVVCVMANGVRLFLNRSLLHFPAAAKVVDYGHGDNYNLDTLTINAVPGEEETKMIPGTMMSGWAFTHMLSYAILAFACPGLVFWMVIVSFTWEMFEWIANGESLWDIVWNFVGIAIGFTLRMIVSPPRDC